jgi:DNA-binding MarR family transcriptional regulator
MASQESLWEQARGIHRTIRMIKENLVRKHLERHRALDDTEDLCASLTFPQFNALMTLRDAGTVSIKELAESLHVSAPSASTMVDRLVDLGVVAREQNPEDRRTVCVQLTEAGGSALQEMEEALLGEIVRLFGRLGPEMSAQWVTIYRRIAAILDEDAHNAVGAPNTPSEDA